MMLLKIIQLVLGLVFLWGAATFAPTNLWAALALVICAVILLGFFFFGARP